MRKIEFFQNRELNTKKPDASASGFFIWCLLFCDGGEGVHHITEARSEAIGALYGVVRLSDAASVGCRNNVDRLHSAGAVLCAVSGDVNALAGIVESKRLLLNRVKIFGERSCERIGGGVCALGA